MPKKPAKTKLAALFSQLNLFIPERDGSGVWTGKFLVNQKTVNQRKAEIGKMADTSKLPAVCIPPDRDDLLHMIGEASIELTSFIIEHDKLLDYAATTAAGVMQSSDTLNSLLGDGDHTDDFQAKLLLVAGRYRQMLSLIQKIAAGDMVSPKDSCDSFLSHKPERFALVNQTDEKEAEESETDANGGEFVCPACGYPDKDKELHRCPGRHAACTCHDPGIICPMHGFLCESCGNPGHLTIHCPGPSPSSPADTIPPEDKP